MCITYSLCMLSSFVFALEFLGLRMRERVFFEGKHC